jgi:ketosteroid isomerase-like protein
LTVSQENVGIVRRAFAAFQEGLASGDWEAAFDPEVVDPNFEWIPAAEMTGVAGSYRGPRPFVEFMRTWTEDFDDWSVELERLVDAGDGRVVAIARQHATGKASRAPVELHFAQVLELENGRVVRMRAYVDPAAALEAVGLTD